MTKKNSDPKDQNKPILIHVDKYEVEKSLHKLNTIILPALEKVKQEFERLQIGPLTGAYLKDLLFDNMTATRKQIRAEIGKEMPSRFLRDEAERKAKEMLNRVASALAALNSKLDLYAIYDLLEYPSVDENGNIVLTEEAIQTLNDANSIYATTSKAKELYEVHKAAAEVLDRFYQMVKAEVTSNTADLARFFIIDEDDRLKPEVIDYEYHEYVTGKIRNFV